MNELEIALQLGPKVDSEEYTGTYVTYCHKCGKRKPLNFDSKLCRPCTINWFASHSS